MALLALLVIGMVAAIASFRTSVPGRDTRQAAETQTDLRRVREAIVAFYISTGGLPCPAGTADGLAEATCPAEADLVGYLPYRDLGLASSLGVDRYGNPLTYAVADNPDSPTLSPSVNGADFDYVIVSHGANGGRSRADTAAATTNVDEDENADADLTFADSPHERTPANPDDYFDDILMYATVDNLRTSSAQGPDFDLDVAGDLAKVSGTVDSTSKKTVAPIIGVHPDGSGANAIVFGEESGGVISEVGTNNYTSCSWIDQTFPMTTETLRAYFRFQFYPGQYWDNTNSDKTTGDGFTFAILPGSTQTTDAQTGQVCGKAGHNQGLGYKDGVPLPKMAVEFDIYNNNYGDEDALRHNHVGLLLTYRTNQDYIGNGSGTNPGCGPSDLSSNGSTGSCTFRRSADGFAAPNVIFLEKQDGNAYSYIDGGKAAEVHDVRVEIARLCDATCGACGQPGGEKMLTKVWIKCATADCQDTTKAYAGAWTENSLNYCHDDPGVRYEALYGDATKTYATAKVGFTMGANGANTGVILSAVKISSN